MRREPYPDVLEVWGLTRTKRGDVWEGPPTGDPTPYLPLALELGRIAVRGGRYVMADPGLTLDRFGWDEDDAEGMTLTQAGGTVLPLADTGKAEEGS
jgi:hypothetical protein